MENPPSLGVGRGSGWDAGDPVRLLNEAGVSFLRKIRWAHLFYCGHHPGHQHDACSLRRVVNTPGEKDKGLA